MARTYKEVFNGQETGKVYRPITRYLKIKSSECTRRSIFADYCYFEDGEKKADYLYFMWGRKKIAFGDVERLTHPIFVEDEDGKLIVISGYYTISNCLSILVEIDDSCECVRVWKEEEE